MTNGKVCDIVQRDEQRQNLDNKTGTGGLKLILMENFITGNKSGHYGVETRAEEPGLY